MRVARLPGVVVEAAEADDFGHVELKLTIGGRRYWTRIVKLDDKRGYARVRDGIAACRRDDWDRARNWLIHTAPPRIEVRWNRTEQILFACNEYGWNTWR